MIACICGHEALTEDDLKSHFIECHSLSYGLESSCQRETSSALSNADRIPETSRGSLGTGIAA
jgi:hypothetical protein